jgi:hypothetical protein
MDIPIQQVPPLTGPQIESVSKELIQLLSHSPPERLRPILRGLIHEITSTREGNTVKGVIQYFYPFDPAPTLSITPGPLGAPVYRQLFSHPFEGKTRSL